MFPISLEIRRLWGVTVAAHFSWCVTTTAHSLFSHISGHLFQGHVSHWCLLLGPFYSPWLSFVPPRSLSKTQPARMPRTATPHARAPQCHTRTLMRPTCLHPVPSTCTPICATCLLDVVRATNVRSCTLCYCASPHLSHNAQSLPRPTPRVWLALLSCSPQACPSCC